MNNRQRPFSLLLVAAAAILALAPTAATALDCTPLADFTCAGSAHYSNLQTNAIPGEPLCGTDYTGWVFNVFTVTLAADNQPAIQTQGPAVTPVSHMLLFDGCPGGACVASDTDGVGDLLIYECLPAGTYTLVLASNSAANDPFAIGTVGCTACQPVAVDEASWGAIKSIFR